MFREDLEEDGTNSKQNKNSKENKKEDDKKEINKKKMKRRTPIRMETNRKTVGRIQKRVKRTEVKTVKKKRHWDDQSQDLFACKKPCTTKCQ